MHRSIFVWILACVLQLTGGLIHAQERHIIELKDKRATALSLNRPQDFLSARSLDRRRRQGINIDSSDLPVCQVYIDSIQRIRNVVVLNASKWLNQIAIQTGDAQALKRIRSFPFVKSVTQASFRSLSRRDDIDLTEETFTDAPTRIRESTTSMLNYGLNRSQIDIHKGAFLHDRGYRGQGMVIAMLDAGYDRFLTNPAFDSLRRNGLVMATWDFVAGESTVHEDNAHGANCLSIMAANMPGKMVGTAPNAGYLLFRTEDVASEYRIEEHFWAVGAERADSMGADVISSSLGYTDFDDPSMNHSYADMNGRTTMVTRAADMAASRGMIVCNSAGNSGASSWKYIGAPADGDSVLAIGAVDAKGSIASFSSFGPTSDGRVKPDLASVGAGTFVALPDGNIAQGNGTSYAAPNLAGLIACLWQAFPEFKNQEIINAVKQSADRYVSPNDRTGYGIPDMSAAFEILSRIRTYRQQEALLGQDRIRVYPVPFSDRITLLYRPVQTGTVTFDLIDVTGRKIRHLELPGVSGVMMSTSFDQLDILPAGSYVLRYTEGSSTGILRMLK
jgi:subtilisin family serine protease